ncbi:hypothetical protein BG015_000954 [Linnemannia schmuckeri]|uniref:GSKIP domain-containing protein n=1 Tax=Linnemannia schmuckeri TaxID=64567 RepID=A0A9P5RQF1_9FUNG|nr:hypothetical protein BG015_000954 [Linnemannia schmuckeri]
MHADRESTMTAMEMVPDLTHYSEGLSPDTFPLKVNSYQENITTMNDSDDSSLTVNFKVVTLEKGTAEIVLDGQGFRTISFSLSPQTPSLRLSTRQEEAVSGHTYETIEAILMALSPGFEAFFGQELARKLENVSWDQNRFQHSSDDGSADELESKDR